MSRQPSGGAEGFLIAVAECLLFYASCIRISRFSVLKPPLLTLAVFAMKTNREIRLKTLKRMKRFWPMYEGECKGCDMWGPVWGIVLCDEREGVLENDLIGKRDWACSAITSICLWHTLLLWPGVEQNWEHSMI